MPEIDFFYFFRRVLVTLVTIYVTVLTLQMLWTWWVWLMGADKYIGMLRRYLIVHALRLRFKSFWGDVLVCILLCVAFMILWRAHGIVYDMNETLIDVRQTHQ